VQADDFCQTLYAQPVYWQTDSTDYIGENISGAAEYLAASYELSAGNHGNVPVHLGGDQLGKVLINSAFYHTEARLWRLWHGLPRGVT